MTFRSYVYANSLDGVIILISFGVYSFVIYICMHDILVDYLHYYKVFRVRVWVSI